ncbi:MAG: hypothetical protein WD377_09060 [Nitriliruptoraceae bacterium]
MNPWQRVRRWFQGGASSRREPSLAESERTTDRAARDALDAFVTSRHGVEAYLEPRTAMYSTTLLLIADDGEYLRRPVRGADAARSLCRQWNVPLYDAAKVGYPRRLHDYVRGHRRAPVRLEDLPPWPSDDDVTLDPPTSPDEQDPDNE